MLEQSDKKFLWPLLQCWRMCFWKMVERLEGMLVRSEVDSLFRSVGQGPLSWRVWLHVLYSLPTITESFDSDRVAGDLSQQPCSSRQADSALDFSRTEVTKINDTDSLKRLGQVRSDAGKKCELYRWSREGRPNPISPSGLDGSGYVFTEEMLEIAPFAKIFATGPENPLKDRYCFYCMICRRNVSMKSRGLSELKRHFQREHHLRAD